MYKDIIKKAGFKFTKSRKLVLEAFEKQTHPISAQDLFDSIEESIDLASVYRTLKLFESLNIVFKERFNNRELFYMSEKQHHHIICEKCNFAKCIPCDHIFSNIKEFSNISHNITLSGLCQKCSN